MAEDLGEREQIASALEQKRGAGVPKLMRADSPPEHRADVAQNVAQAGVGQAGISVRRDKELRARSSALTTSKEICLQYAAQVLTNRDHAVLRSLPLANEERSSFKADVGQLQAEELCLPKAGVNHRREHGVVTAALKGTPAGVGPGDF